MIDGSVCHRGFQDHAEGIVAYAQKRFLMLFCLENLKKETSARSMQCDKFP